LLIRLEREVAKSKSLNHRSLNVRTTERCCKTPTFAL
jgi:hypothetical protein